MATNTTTIKFVGQFDSSGITKGLQEIKKQMSNTHIGEDLRKQLETALSKVEANIPALEKMSAKGEYNTKELEEFQKIIQQVSKDMQSLDKLAGEADFTKVFSKADNDKVKQFEKQLNDVENKIKSFKKEIIESTEQKEKTKIEGGMESIVDQLLSVKPDEIRSKFDEIVKETTIQSDKAKQELEQALSSKSSSFKQNSDVINFLFGKDSNVTIKHGMGGKAVQAIQQAKEAIQSLAKGEEVKDASQKLERLYQLVSGTGEFEGVFENPNGIKSQFEGIISTIQSGDFDKVEKLLPTLEEFSKNKFTFIQEGEAEKLKITEEYAAFLNERLQSLAESGQLTKQQIALVSKELGIFNDKTKEGIEYTKSEKTQMDALSATFGGLAHRIESTVSAMAVFNKSMQIVRQAIHSVEELDAAFTQIAIVSEQSGEAAWRLFDSFNSLAKQYSITTKDLTEGAKLFYQQGLSAADTMKMVEASTVSAALGEVTMTEAANTLTAAIQGYNESAAVAMDYTDKIAMVGAVSAADFNELSAAMEKTASSAYTAGIDFDHLLGYLGKMIEVTREAPANIGTAMKTIIARFEDMKKDPAKALEDGVSFNKVEEALGTLGIALRDTVGEFRPLQDVFDELGMKWETLTRNQQAYIATVAAGSRQQSRFLAMMNNYPRTLDLITEAQNSAGAAARQYATYQDSIAAAQARLTASWEKFYSKIVDNGAIKLAINGLSSLVEVLSHIPPAITAIGASIGALGLQNLLQKNGGLVTIIGKLLGNNAEKSIGDVGINLAERFINGFKEKSISEIANTTSIWKALSKSAEQSGTNLGKLSTSLSEVGSGFVTVGKTMIGFIAGNWQIIAIAALVGGAIYLINRALTKQKQEYEETTESIKKYQQEANELTSKTNNAEDLIHNYEELATKTKRTAEEQNQLNSVIKEISDIYPEAITWVDEYGNSHLENINFLKEEIELEKQLAKEKNRAALEERDTLLKSNRENWEKEDFTEIGFSNAQIDAYFKLQDELDYYQKIVKQFYSGDKHSSNLERNINSLQFAIDNEDINKLEAANLGLEEINKTIEKYHLNVEKLAEGSSWEQVLNKAESIIYQHDYTDEIIENLEKQQDNIVKRLQKDNSISLNFMDIGFSNKAGTATAQRAVSAQLQSFFSSMGTEAFESFKNSLPTGSLAEYVQNIIDNIDDADEAIEVKNLFEEAFDPSTSEKRLSELYSELGKKLGWEAGDGFQESFQKAIEENRQKIREDLEGAVTSTFQGRGKLPTYFGNYSNERLQSINELGKESQDLNFDEAAQMASFYEQAKKLQEEAIMNGSIEGLEESLEKIDTSSLPEDLKEIFKIIIDAILKDTIDKIAEDAFSKLQQESQEFISNTKKSLDSIQSEGKVSAKDYGLEEKDYSFGVYFDPTSGEKVVSTARVLLDIEEENNKKLEDTKRIYKNNLELIEQIKNKGENVSSTERKRLKQLEDENEVLIAQYKYYQKIENITLEAGWNTSIQLAKDYQSQLQTISNLEKAMEEQGGVLFLDDMEEAMSILPEFQNRFTEVSDNTYTISAENIEAMKKEIKSQYDLWLAQEKAKATVEYENAVANYELIKTLAEQEGIVDKNNTDQFIENNKAELQSTKSELEQSLNASYDEIKQELNAHSEKDDQMVQMFNKALNEMGKNYELFIEDIKSGNVEHIYDELYKEIQSQPLSATTEITIQTELLDDLQDPEKQEERKRILTAALEEASQRVQTAWKKLTSLKEINVPELDKLKHQLEGASKGGKEAEKTLEALADAIDDLINALDDLDKLLKDVNRDLKDISVDYNPFTDLFEAWEKEWDYYYNIKRLIAQIGQQGQYIDNIISADYISADAKVNAYHAKIGNVLSKMSANDAYIEALRAGMSQTAVELTEQYGQYYKVDPTTGQIYQTDKNLTDINNRINAARQEVYDLQKLQNEKENDLALENAKLDALEQEKSAYESILSTIESQLDSLEDNEDIITDLSGLKDQQASLKAKIEISDDSIDEVKDRVRSMEDEIQEIEVQITLNERTVDKLENYVDKMEDKVSEYEEYWETLNSTIAEQQELLQELYEIQQTYIDTAIDTQQQLYDAIVEQYQDEINEKKKQYDYLKQLDNEYLQSVRESIDKERQLREDSNKQKSYQQNLQRAQLLQMDTSGTYRTELANLKKDIEAQRQDLYDDLVDKQVKALEKEIEKRHELYDKEVAALEERLAYYQENAILLWEMVNSIVSEGAETMMATLENTTAYINSNELSKQQQRLAWANNIQMTLDGVKNGTINMLNGLIVAGNNYINNKLPEIGNSLDEYSIEFTNAGEYINSTTQRSAEVFQGILDSFMATWNQRTNEFTAYAKNWTDITASLKAQTEKNLIDLTGLNERIITQGDITLGSIEAFGDKVEEINQEMYDDFINERQRYRDELNGLINTIRTEIEAAVKAAADAIRGAVAGLQSGTPTSQGAGSNGSGNNNSIQTKSSSGNSTGGYKGYTVWVNIPNYNLTGKDYSYQEKASFTNATYEQLIKNYNNLVDSIRRKYSANATFWGFTPFKTGGIADFTGPAWLDGTKSQPEAVLNAKQTKLFTSMVSSLEKASNNSNINSALGSSYNIGDINTNINVERLDNETDIDKVARQVENRIMKSIRNRVSMAVA